MLAPLYWISQFIWFVGVVMHFITIPGSFFHELAHQLACYVVGHRVLEVRYIVRDNPAYAGYVLHQGPPGVFRHLLIGIAPLLMGFAIWAGTLALGWFFLRDGSITLWQVGFLIMAAWMTAAATYAALPSPLDMEGVFQQPFSILTVPCYLIAGPVWLIAHDYRLSLWGWTVWRALVLAGTAYVIFMLITADTPQWSNQAGIVGGIAGVFGGLFESAADAIRSVVDRIAALIPALP